MQDGLLKQCPLPLGLLISPHTQPSKLSPGAFFWDENRHVGSSKWASISKPWENLGRWVLCYYPLLQTRKPRHLIYVQLVLGRTSGKRCTWDLNLHLLTLQGSVLSFSTPSFHEWTPVIPVWVKLRGQCLPSSSRVSGVLFRAPQRAGTGSWLCVRLPDMGSEGLVERRQPWGSAATRRRRVWRVVPSGSTAPFGILWQ